MAGLYVTMLTAALCVCAAHANEGTPAKISWAPWSAQLVFHDSAHNPIHDITCVGSIVDTKHILTAASCIHAGEHINVVVGATEWNKGGQTHAIESVAVVHDLAVITLESTLEFDKNVQAIAIAGKRVKDNIHVLSAGWCAEKGEAVLRKTVLNTMPEEMCNGKLCTKILRGQSCHGDVGSGVWTAPIPDRPASGGRPPKTGQPAQLLGVLQAGAAEATAPVFIDLTDKTAREFLVTMKVLKKGLL